MTSFAKVCIDLSNNLRHFRFNKSTTSASLNNSEANHKQPDANAGSLSSVDTLVKETNVNGGEGHHVMVELNGSRSAPRQNGLRSHQNRSDTKVNQLINSNKKQAPPIPPKLNLNQTKMKNPDIEKSSTAKIENREGTNVNDSRPMVVSPKIERKFYSTLNATDRSVDVETLERENSNSAKYDQLRVTNRNTFSPTIAHRVAALTKACQYNYFGSDTNTNESQLTTRSGCLSNGGSPILPHRGTSVAAIKQRLLSQGLKIDLQTGCSQAIRNTRYRDHVRRLVRGRGFVLASLWKDDQLLRLIFSALSGSDLLTACIVCKHWYQVIVDKGFWDRIAIKMDMRQLMRDAEMNIRRPLITTNQVPHENQLMQDLNKIQLNLERQLTKRLRCGVRRKIKSLFIIYLTNRHAPHLHNAMVTVLHNVGLSEPLMTVPTCIITSSLSAPYKSPILSSSSSSRHPLLPIQPYNSLTQATHSFFDSQQRRYTDASSFSSDEPAFTQLKLLCCSISDDDLERTVHLLAGINSLELHCCNQISEMAFWVCLEPTIERLQISDCINVSDESVSAIVQLLPCLTEISLQAYHVSDMALTYFTVDQRETLRVIRLIQCMDLTNQGVTNLAFALPNLIELSLSGCNGVGDDGVAVICDQLKQLTRLDLSWCSKITDRGLEPMTTELPMMQKLTLDRCVAITDIGIGHLSTMSGLSHLNIRWCANLSDGTIPHLLCMTGLTDLSLTGCKRITEDGMCQLARHPRLRRIELMHCPGASVRVKEYLLSNLSGCRIRD